MAVSYTHLDVYKRQIQNHGFAIVDLPQTPIQKINGYPRLSEMLGLWFGIFAGRRLIDLPNVLLMPGFFCAIFASCRRQSVDTLSSLGWAGVGTTIPAYVCLLYTSLGRLPPARTRRDVNLGYVLSGLMSRVANAEAYFKFATLHVRR